MILVKLSELLGKHKMTRKRLADLIGARPNTIGDIYDERIKKIDLAMLSKMCEVFGCGVAEILEYKASDDSTYQSNEVGGSK